MRTRTDFSWHLTSLKFHNQCAVTKINKLVGNSTAQLSTADCATNSVSQAVTQSVSHSFSQSGSQWSKPALAACVSARCKQPLHAHLHVRMPLHWQLGTNSLQRRRTTWSCLAGAAWSHRQSQHGSQLSQGLPWWSFVCLSFARCVRKKRVNDEQQNSRGRQRKGERRTERDREGMGGRQGAAGTQSAGCFKRTHNGFWPELPLTLNSHLYSHSHSHSHSHWQSQLVFTRNWYKFNVCVCVCVDSCA